MAKNLLVINVDIRETRVALIENGIIAELHIERETSKGTLGNIYLGKVSRVLPGMQAAFIDVGLERAAFLHVEDLIRPDDFEAYLAGHRRGTDDERSSSSREEEPSDRIPPPRQSSVQATAPAAAEAEEERDVDIELPTALEVQEAGDATSGTLAAEDVPDDEVSDEEEQEARAEQEAEDDAIAAAEAEAEAAGDVEPEPDDLEAADEAADEPAEAGDELAEAGDGEPLDAAEGDLAAAEGEIEPAEGGEAPAEGEIAVAVEGEVALAEATVSTEMVRVPEEGATVPRARGRRGRGKRDARVRRSGRTTDRQPGGGGGATGGGEPQARRDEQQPREQQPREQRGRDRGERGERGDRGERSGRGRGGDRDRGRQGGGRQPQGGRSEREPRRGGQHEPPRISKSTPIREVIREGQEVLVQISKEPIGTKGARVTSHISLAGRYVVYLPTVDHVGISKRIGSDKERGRLREAIEAMKPPQGGLIVRTVAEGLTKKQLKADVGYLVRLWGEVVKKRETGVRAPVGLYTELDLVLKTARDLFTDDIEKIVIDSREEYERLRRFLEVFLPERIDDIELYEGEEPIFDAYGIEDEIQRAQSRKVPLPSGGYLIIDQAEALTAIDVNTGRFVGKGSKDLEETILATNLEAVEEIAYQLRFRNIGGLIILDLIDMERASNREKVRKRMEELLARDKAKTTLNRISDLGLIEMTRKRTRESLGRIVLEPCFYCDGTGQLQSKQTIAYEILRQIRRERMNLPGYIIVVNAHSAVIDLLKSDERVAVTEAERLFQRRIELVPRKEYHLEQFDLQGR
jgi:ribonuclease G